MKIVINKCYGGFSISPLATLEYYKLKNIKAFLFKENYNNSIKSYISTKDLEDNNLSIIAFSIDNPNETDSKILWDNYLTNRPEDRSDKDLIKVIEKLGEKANRSYALLEIIEIPDDINYYIYNYDGMESIHEQHQSWG